MREETRYRVTGSMFLLAIAVICLPMLLDGAGLPAKRLADLPMDDSLPEVRPLGERAPESDFAARVEALRGQVDEDGFLTGSGTRFGEPVLSPGQPPETAPGQEQDVHPVEAEGAGSADQTPRHGVQTVAWAVLVASFARAGNAEEFRTRLRADGYEAFVSTAKLRGQVLSRVAVGPVLERGRAERLRQELSARYDVRARLMAFSN